ARVREAVLQEQLLCDGDQLLAASGELACARVAVRAIVAERLFHGRSGAGTLDCEARSFLRRSTNTKKSGTNTVATNVAMIMPPNTPVPIDCRAAAPAPVATTSGTTPSTKASEVMTIGRKRRRAASLAASIGDLPSSTPRCANSTIRIAFFAARPISTIKPIWK